MSIATELHPLSHVLMAFATNLSVQCRVRPTAKHETQWRAASLQDVANGASDVEFRVVAPGQSADDVFNGLFDCVVEGLHEYYPLSLGNADVVGVLRRAVRAGWTGTGNNQSDYEALRNAVEREVNNFGAVSRDLPVYNVQISVEIHNENGLYVAALKKLMSTGIEAAEAEAFLRKGGVVDVEACLVQVIDPGESPEGIQIIDSSATIEA
jgi:hypothetical protein